MKRLFVAIYPGAEVRLGVHGRAQEAFSRERFAEDVRFSPAENLHITLTFLGAVEDSRVSSIEAAIRRAAAGCSPFSVELEGLGIFPGILWAGVTRESGAALGFVARVLEAELEREGFPRDGKAFRPHLTIARARGRRSVRLPPRAQSLSFSEFRWRADEIVLMESLTLPEGARYEVISSALMTER